LAGAVRPKEPEDPARLDGEADIADSSEIVERLGDVRYVETHRCWSFPVLTSCPSCRYRANSRPLPRAQESGAAPRGSRSAPASPPAPRYAPAPPATTASLPHRASGREIGRASCRQRPEICMLAVSLQ